MTDDGLICAYVLDGEGGGRETDLQGVSTWSGEQGFVWVHLDYTIIAAQHWLREKSGLDETLCDALLAEDARPRSVPLQDGLLVALRGVNLNPGADAEDMVSVRILIERDRIVSTRKRRLLAFQDLRDAIAREKGPKTPGEFVVEVADRLVVRMANVIQDLDDAVDQLEEEVLTAESHQLRVRLAHIRRETILLRRYLAPQREALARLQIEKTPLLNDANRMQLREITDRTMRYVEDLDAARDRAAVTQEELNSRLSEQLNKRMYVLSIVAAIFLPLGFVTGLLGINVGGIPGAEFSLAFAVVCLALLMVVVLQIGLFKWKKWM